LTKAWKEAGGKGEWGVPKTWQQVQTVTKFLKGKKLAGRDAVGYLDPAKPWAGSASISWAVAPLPTPSTPTTRRGSSTSTR